MREKLEFKVLVIGFIIMAGGVLLASLLVINKVEDDVHALSGERLTATAKVITKSIERTMVEGKANLTKGLAEDLKSVSGYELHIYNYEGREAFNIKASTEEDEALKSVLISGSEILMRDGMTMKAYMPLNNTPLCKGCHSAERNVIGAVRMSISLEKEHEKMRAFIINMAFGSVIGILIIGTIVWQLLRRNVIVPLKTLESCSVKMAEGDLSFRTNIRSSDEIGRLDSSIKDSMMAISGILKRVKDVSRRISNTAEAVGKQSDKVVEGTLTEAEAVAEISSSVEELNAAITEIADGTQSLVKSVEDTAASMEEMTTAISSVTGITHEVSEGVDTTSSAIEQMSATIRQVAEGAEDLARVSDETVSAVEEIIASVKEVEGLAKESARFSVKVADDASTSGVTAIGKTKEGMEKIRDSVNKTAVLIRKLGRRSEEIGNILNVIDDIADQTTLLALNAAILAAQAGEHGKGFSVVANEIKDLAERTTFSTKEIDKLVNDVRMEVAESVAAMDEGLRAVENGLMLSREATDVFKMILDSAKKSSDMASGIERTTTEQAKTARYVSDAVDRVRGMVQQIEKATSEQSKGVSHILKFAERMRDASHKADKATEQQAGGSKQIARAVEVISDRTQQISRAIHEQKMGANQIWSSVEKIKDLPDANRGLAFEINKAVRELSRNADLINMEMERFSMFEERAADILRLGVVPYDSPTELFRKFGPIVGYLSEQIGKKVELRVATDFKSAVSDLAQGNTQLCFMTSLTYIEARKNLGAKVMVKTLRDGRPFHRSVIIARTDSRINSVSDLKKRSFAFVDPASTSGFVVPRAMLLEEGVTLNDLSYYNFLGHHDDVVNAVLKQDFDAGGVMESIAQRYKGHGISIIKTSSDIPEFNISAAGSIKDAEFEAVRAALLKLGEGNPRTKEVIGALDRSLTGFTEAADSDFDVIRQMAGKMGDI